MQRAIEHGVDFTLPRGQRRHRLLRRHLPADLLLINMIGHRLIQRLFGRRGRTRLGTRRLPAASDRKIQQTEQRSRRMV